MLLLDAIYMPVALYRVPHSPMYLQLYMCNRWMSADVCPTCSQCHVHTTPFSLARSPPGLHHAHANGQLPSRDYPEVKLACLRDDCEGHILSCWNVITACSVFFFKRIADENILLATCMMLGPMLATHLCAIYLLSVRLQQTKLQDVCSIHPIQKQCTLDALCVAQIVLDTCSRNKMILAWIPPGPGTWFCDLKALILVHALGPINGNTGGNQTQLMETQGTNLHELQSILDWEQPNYWAGPTNIPNKLIAETAFAMSGACLHA